MSESSRVESQTLLKSLSFPFLSFRFETAHLDRHIHIHGWEEEEETFGRRHSLTKLYYCNTYVVVVVCTNLQSCVVIYTSIMALSKIKRGTFDILRKMWDCVVRGSGVQKSIPILIVISFSYLYFKLVSGSLCMANEAFHAISI